MGWNKLLMGAVLVICVAAIYLGWGSLNGAFTFSSNENKETITFGYVGALTTDFSSYGLTLKNGGEMAVNKINSQGGVLGKKINIVYEDGQCNAKEAITAANKLIELDNVKVILGGSCSTETLAMAPLVEKNEVILFSSFSTNPAITNSGEYIFRNVPSDSYGGTQIANLIAEKGYKQIAVLSENSDFSQGLRKIFIDQVKQKGLAVVADEVYELGAHDYRTQLLKIKESNPDAIFFNALSDVTGGLSVKQAWEMDINAQYFGYNVFSSKNALSNAGSAANGLLFADVPVLDTNNPAAAKFLDEYTASFGTPASDFAAGASYDAVYLIKDAIESCKKVDSNCIRDYLYFVKDFNGLIGQYGFDNHGDVVGINFQLKEVVDAQKGETVVLEK